MGSIKHHTLTSAPPPDLVPENWNEDHDVDLSAADIDFEPAGTIAATDVQGAIEELDSEKAGTGHNHDGTYEPADADIPTVAASQVEMEAGTEAALRSMSPLRVAQAIAAQASGGPGPSLLQAASGNTWAAAHAYTAGDLIDVTYTPASLGFEITAVWAAGISETSGATIPDFPEDYPLDPDTVGEGGVISDGDLTWVLIGFVGELPLQADDALLALPGYLNRWQANDPNTQAIKDHGTLGATETFSLDDAPVHKAVLGDDTEITLDSSAPAGRDRTMVLKLIGDGTARSISWTNVTWDGGEAPEFDFTLDAVNRVIVETDDPASGWLGVKTGPGAAGADGVGLPAGGTITQILAKASGDDFDTEWVDAPTGGGLSSFETFLAALTGKVHRWECTEGSGSLIDSIGSLDLAATGLTYHADGPLGVDSAVVFGGSANAVSTGLGSLPVGAAARTFVVVYQAPASTSKQCLWAYGDTGTHNWWTAFINDGQVDTFSCSVFNDDVNMGYNDAMWRPDTSHLAWHLGIITYDGGTIVEVIHDEMTARNILDDGVLSTANTGNFHLGQDIAGGNQAAIALDDLTVFDRRLDNWEVEGLRQRFWALLVA